MTRKELSDDGYITVRKLGRLIDKDWLRPKDLPKQFFENAIFFGNCYYISKDKAEELKKYILELSKTEKYLKTVNEKYGVDNISQLDDIKKKKAETMISNYGTSKSFELQSTKNTIKEKYGVDNISQLDDIKEKKAETCKKHYGVEAGFLTEKAKDSIREKYGVDNISQVPEIQEKKLLTSRKKYLFDDVVFDSAWEMAYYFYLKEKGIEFEFHPKEFLEYTYKGKIHRYFPDFKINNKYVEIKGDYWYGIMLKKNTVENAKLNCLRENNIDILLKEDIMPYLEEFEKANGKCCNFRKE